MKINNKIILVFLSLALVTGCATNRGIIDVESSVSMNPVDGEAIKFTRVTDKRDFQLKPRQANIPSLKNGEIDDPSITARAIARKRNTYGKALGDILLPDGKTVMDVVENRLSAGFRENGYRVLSAGETGYTEAIPIEVDIEKFWGWFNPGFWSIGLNFQTSIIVTAPLGSFSEGLQFGSEVEKRFQTAAGSNWQTVINLSLDELNQDIREKLTQ